MMVQRPRGTRDFTPIEMKRRLALENLLEKCSRSFGYSRVQTPIFESLDLFTAKSGPGVVDQLYAFKDKSDRDLTLRPELTAPVMRMVADEMRVVTKPLRLSYFGQCFRYEESKKGRYREFFQYGAESIGIKGPLAEAEIVALALEMLHATGLENWELRIGHVGILHEILTGLGLSDEGEPESEVQSAMRLLDKGDWQGLEKMIPAENIPPLQELADLDGGSEILSAAEKILSTLGIEGNSLEELREMLAALNDLATAPPSLKVDLTVARGLDYYTGMVFEIQVDSLGGEGQILGGGSYRLLHLFGLADLDPCCGFGLGFDRVLLALEAQAAAKGSEEIVPGENSSNPLAVIPFKIPASEVLSLVKSLRVNGQEVVVELKSRGLGKSLSWADAVGASHALIIGPKDLESGTCNVKNLQTGQQVECNLDAEAILASL
jgi:histidyl-tRNA synthetase